MDKLKLVKCLEELNIFDFEVNQMTFEDTLRIKCEKCLEHFQCTYDDIVERVKPMLTIFPETKDTYEWKYVCLNFYIIQLLNEQISTAEILTVRETKIVESCLQTFMRYGILKNIQLNLPYSFVMENSVESDVMYTYHILKSTLTWYTKCIKCLNLRMLILPHCLQGILVGIYQLAYCPLKKPCKEQTQDNFIITKGAYTQLLQDQILFKEILDDLARSIHPTIFVKETMVLFQAQSPMWFKRAISTTLTKILKSKKGVENIAFAMLGGYDNDTTRTWQILEILTKLITSCRKFSDFRNNISLQVLNLLVLAKRSDKDLLLFERLVISCTKSLYVEDPEVCEAVFIKEITSGLRRFTSQNFGGEEEFTDDIVQTIRLVHGCFVDNSLNLPCLPIEMLKNLINIIYNFYRLTIKSTFQSTNKELKEILSNFLNQYPSQYIDSLFDSILFGFSATDISQFRNDIIVEVNEVITIKQSQYTVIYATADSINAIFDIINTNKKICLFGYLLKCLTDKQKYFPTNSNKEDLIGLEVNPSNAVLERLLAVHKVLTQLSDDKDVQKSLKLNPDVFIEYIKNILSFDSNDDLLFIVVMILDNLVSNCSKTELKQFDVLIEILKKLAEKNANNELKCLLNKVLGLIERKTEPSELNTPLQKSPFEKALEDISDPLLPVRGHGLLMLTKLLEKKDVEALSNKQYLLNLFQIHLKNEDSFIYLNAVHGLAAMADVSTDTVLEILCEEYSDFDKKYDEKQETRMKLGEALMRITKILGEMAPQYKSLLLNTFLSATKDDDYLIRASSLSNLGELCRILNFKLGTIVTEVLVCVHGIIATDKAVEARRAAVTVIRQLFNGLQSEMITFLKEDILPIYRTLKQIYYHDQDDVMKLQAQLALEELNENMKSFVFSSPQLHLDKKNYII